VNGGSQYVTAGGVASGTMLNDGIQYVSSGGIARRTIVSGTAFQYVSAHGVASDTVVTAGGTQIVLPGGGADGTIVSSCGVAIGIVLTGSDPEVVYSGGTASDTTVFLGSEIDLPDLIFTSGGTATLNTSSNILTVTEGGASYQQQLLSAFAGRHSGRHGTTSAGRWSRRHASARVR
jgi:autotransporter passenger strand-loop-strand repeat protein